MTGLSRAAYYKRSEPASERDADVIDVLNKIVEKYRCWGFWKYFSRLRLVVTRGTINAYTACIAIWD